MLIAAGCIALESSGELTFDTGLCKFEDVGQARLHAQSSRTTIPNIIVRSSIGSRFLNVDSIVCLLRDAERATTVPDPSLCMPK